MTIIQVEEGCGIEIKARGDRRADLTMIQGGYSATVIVNPEQALRLIRELSKIGEPQDIANDSSP